MILSRFEMGRVIHALQGGLDHQGKYGKGTIRSLHDNYGIPETTLRECYLFYIDDRWQRDRKRVERELADETMTAWVHVQKQIKSNTSPRALGPDAWLDKTIRRTEQFGIDLASFNEYADQLDHEKAMQLSGVIQQTRAELAEAARKIPSAIGPDYIPRSPEYLAFIRRQPCCVTGVIGEDIHPHHLGGDGGTALKGSDFLCVPLRWDQHSRLHEVGQVSFQEETGVDLYFEATRFLHIYFVGVDPFTL